MTLVLIGLLFLQIVSYKIVNMTLYLKNILKNRLRHPKRHCNTFTYDTFLFCRIKYSIRTLIYFRHPINSIAVTLVCPEPIWVVSIHMVHCCSCLRTSHLLPLIVDHKAQIISFRINKNITMSYIFIWVIVRRTNY